jgi:hypothetical protein
LASIAVQDKLAVSGKAGDLTPFFELARRQALAPSAAPLIEPPPAEPAVPELVESAPEPMPSASAPIEMPVAELSPDPAPLQASSELAPTEPVGSIEPMSDMALEPWSETDVPLLLAPPIAKEFPEATLPASNEMAPAVEPLFSALEASDFTESLARIEALTAKETTSAPQTPEPATPAVEPTESTSLSLEIAEPAPGVVEPPAIPAPAVEVEAAAPAAPEPPPAVEPAPAVALAPVEPLPVPTPPAAPEFTELADYWRSLLGGEDHPTLDSIDRDLVTERWPGSLLIAYTPASQDPRGELRPGRVTRLGTACAATQSAVDAGSHSTEWMLEVARAALVNDEPVEEQQRLATLTGVAGFRMVALPLGPSNGLASAVLCTLLPSAVAPRFGKRRTWL